MKMHLKITHGPGTEHASFVISKEEEMTSEGFKEFEKWLLDLLTGDNPVMSVFLENGNKLILPSKVLLNSSIEICIADE